MYESYKKARDKLVKAVTDSMCRRIIIVVSVLVDNCTRSVYKGDAQESVQ
jgi:hypothetical protein